MAHIILAREGILPLCLSIIQAIALKLGIHNPHHKKAPFAYSVLFSWHHEHHEIFSISVTGFNKSGYYLNLKCNKESHWLQNLWDTFLESCALNMYSGVFRVNNKQFVKHERGYQWRQRNGTNEVVLVTLLLNSRKITHFLLFNVWISEFPMGGYFFKTCFLNG